MIWRCETIKLLWAAVVLVGFAMSCHAQLAVNIQPGYMSPAGQNGCPTSGACFVAYGSTLPTTSGSGTPIAFPTQSVAEGVQIGYMAAAGTNGCPTTNACFVAYGATIPVSGGGGGGTVTSLANPSVFGVTCSVANATTVPAITCTAGTPNLGTPSAIVLTNATGLPAAQVPVTPTTTGTNVTLSGPRAYYACTSTCTVTLPVPVTGYEFCIRNDDNVSTVITLAALGSSARYEQTARTGYGTAGTGTAVSPGAVTDQICLLGKDSTHYYVMSSTGTWIMN